uniref:Telomerase reverse transcriptase n=1 Tax=Cyprinus carpio TaxID=7962 RepID=A0A8C1X313_CYPCA
MSRRDATEGGFKHVFAILRSLYPRVQTLQEFADGLVFSDGRKPVLLDEKDGARFQKLCIYLLFSCYFSEQCPNCDIKSLGTLPEVLAFTLNHIKRKKLRNVLGFGYQCSDVAAGSDPFRFHGDVSQTAASISTSELWKRINQRLGTEVTRYLLQDCAIFATVPPSCLLQVCGEPVYDLLLPRTWSGFFLDRATTQTSSGVTRKTPVGVARKKVTRDDKKIVSKKRAREEEIDDERRDRPAVKKRRLTMDENDGSLNSRNPESHGSRSWKPADQCPPRPSRCSIRVLSMLYGGRGLKGFLLNRKLKAGVGGARRLQGADLVRVIFLQSESSVFDGQAKFRKLPKRFFAMVPLFARLLRQHRKCPYALFLRRKCSVNPEAEDMESLLKLHLSPYRVYLFVRECLRYVVPEELWGSQENQLHFLSNVKNFLRLGKFERLPLMQLMWKMKVKACHWLGLKKRHCASEHRYREWICGQFLGWMLSGYVVGLVKALFYVTESMGQKHTLRFYRGEVWIRLQEMAFRAHLSKGQWRALSPSQALKFPKTTVTSRIRFIPKVNSMRPITRLSGPRDSLQVRLSCVCVSHDSRRWCCVCQVDVSGAYDSLPHQKLVEVLGEVLRVFSERSFFVRQYARVWKDPHLGLRKHFCTRAEMSEPLNMKGFVVEEQAGGTLHDAILVERHSSEVRGGDVFQFFQKMLSSYIIHHDNKMFRQVCGIPQGSSVSALLCNLCYGHMENSLLKGIAKGGCLMRLVDDFLLITPHLSKATEFLTTLLAGVPDYGCQINPQKVAVNFPVCVEWLDSGVSVLPSCCLFPWCGLLLDTHSLDVYKDYSRYDGLSLRYSLTLGSAHSPTAVIKKLLSVLSLKCTDIFLDLRMNSVEAVYRSLYKLILLQALRFHACVRSLPLGQNVESNPCFFLKMIWTMSRVTNRLIRHINKGLVLGSPDGGGLLQYEAVQMLFCLAFVVVFTRHRSLYRSLLPQLHKRTLVLRNAPIREASVTVLTEIASLERL